MNRRSFIGSVIGLIGSSAFIARPPSKSKDWNLCFQICETGEWVASPGVEKIDKMSTGIHVYAQPFNVKEALSIDRIGLFNPNGFSEAEIPFQNRIYMVSGDTLRVSFTFNTFAGSKIRFVEEFVNWYESRNSTKVSNYC